MKISAELFALAYEAVSNEETGYYLNGVFVQPHHDKGAILVSTDGHLMVVVHDELAEVTETAIIKLPKFVLQQLPSRKGLKHEKKYLSVDVESKSATVLSEQVDKVGVITRSTPIVTAHNIIIEGTYPDWKRVCPKGDMVATGVVGLNSRYLASLGKFGQKFDRPDRGGMYFMKPSEQDNGGPVMLRWGNVHHVFAVLMPYRTDTELQAPSFMIEAEPEAAK